MRLKKFHKKRTWEEVFPKPKITMPFTDTPDGQTHYQNDGCGEKEISDCCGAKKRKWFSNQVFKEYQCSSCGEPFKSSKCEKEKEHNDMQEQKAWLAPIFESDNEFRELTHFMEGKHDEFLHTRGEVLCEAVDEAIAEAHQRGREQGLREAREIVEIEQKSWTGVHAPYLSPFDACEHILEKLEQKYEK